MRRDGDNAGEGSGDGDAGRDASESEAGRDASGGDVGALLSDLSVNAVPILILGIFVSLFWVWAPLGGEGGDPLLLFHVALVVGVVAVSALAGWVIRRQDQPLQGSAGRREE